LTALEKRRGRYYPPGVSGAIARRRRADVPPACWAQRAYLVQVTRTE